MGDDVTLIKILGCQTSTWIEILVCFASPVPGFCILLFTCSLLGFPICVT